MKINYTNLDRERLEAVAADAIAALETSNRADSRRWINAIKKGCAELQSNPFWNYENGELLLMSETSGEIYSPNGKCGCISYAKGNPCRHRSQKRLLDIYAEAD